MQDKLFNIKKVIAFIAFIAVFSLMGLSTGKPVMVLAYAGFFTIVTVVVILLLRKRQRHFEVTETANPKIRKIGGAILLALSLIIPLYVFSTANILNTDIKVNVMFMLIVFGVNVVFMGLLYVAIKLINKLQATSIQRVLGYTLIVLASIIPGAIVSNLDKSTTSIGSTYYLALMIVILAWNGLGLVTNQE